MSHTAVDPPAAGGRSGDGLALLGGDGRLRWRNAALAHVLHLAPGEVPDDARAWVPAADRGRLDAALAEAQDGRSSMLSVAREEAGSALELQCDALEVQGEPLVLVVVRAATATYPGDAVGRMVTASDLPTVAFDPTGTVLVISPAFAELVRRPAEDLVGRSFLAMVHPDDRDAAVALVQRVAEGEQEMLAAEKRLLVDGGHSVLVRATVSPARDADGQVRQLVAVLVPLSRRREFDSMLENDSSLVRIAGQMAQLGGWELEVPSLHGAWSDDIDRLLENPPESEPDLATVIARYVPADGALLQHAIETAIRDATSFDVELGAVTWTGRDIRVRIVGEPEMVDGEVVRLRGAVQDVTAQHAAQREAADLGERLASAMDTLTGGMITLDHDWVVTYVNANGEAIMGTDRSEVVGRGLWDLYPSTMVRSLRPIYERAVRDRTSIVVRDFHWEPTGQVIEVHGRPFAEGMTVYFEDVTERRRHEVERQRLLDEARLAREEALEAQVELAYQVVHDPLTGLFNRREVVSRLLDPAAPPVSVLFLDLDGFKQVNDTLGHTIGDHVLQEVAGRLEAVATDATLVARIGGDEFVVLLPERHDPDVLAKTVLEDLRRPFLLGGHRIHLTTSVGIAPAEGGRAGDVALRDADVALYRAKLGGRDRVERYDESVHRQVIDRLLLTNELRDALDRDDFRLHYQPSFSVRTGRPSGVEALVRWQHRTRGLVAPGTFVPLAEDTGLIGPLGEWCMATAVTAARSMAATDDPARVMWVNVSLRQLASPGLASRVVHLLDRAGVPADRLGVEVTESVLEDDTGAVVAELKILSELGVRIAIDDFGTGFSSLSRLGSLPVDVLKIDQSFIARLDVPSGAATVAAIITLAHAIGAEVVAEGVETPEQLRLLVEQGCDHVSGFLLAHPVTEDALGEAVAAGVAVLADVRRDGAPDA